MSNALSEKLKRKAAGLGVATSDRHTMVAYRSPRGLVFQFDAAGMSTEAFVERFAALLVEEGERHGLWWAREGLRRLLDVPSTKDLEDAVERLEDRMNDR